MKGTYVTIAAKDGGSFKAYLAKPEKGSGPGIVLLQEIFGINRYIRDVADYYAEEGYVVIAPDLFWRLEPGVELDEIQFEKAFGLYQKFNVAKAVDDIVASVTALKARPECAGKIGALGFCLGGALAYLAAAHVGVDCAVGYYGVGIEKSLDLVPKIKCPLVLHFAAADKFVPEAAREQIRAAFAGNQDVEIHVYSGVDHAFARPGGLAYNKPAALMAHSRSVALFRHVMGPHLDLSALWDAHTYHEFANSRRRRHYGDNGEGTLRQPRADHDRQCRLSRSVEDSIGITSFQRHRPTPSSFRSRAP